MLSLLLDLWSRYQSIHPHLNPELRWDPTIWFWCKPATPEVAVRRARSLQLNNGTTKNSTTDLQSAQNIDSQLESIRNSTIWFYTKSYITTRFYSQISYHSHHQQSQTSSDKQSQALLRSTLASSASASATNSTNHITQNVSSHDQAHRRTQVSPLTLFSIQNHLTICRVLPVLIAVGSISVVGGYVRSQLTNQSRTFDRYFSQYNTTKSETVRARTFNGSVPDNRTSLFNVLGW